MSCLHLQPDGVQKDAITELLEVQWLSIIIVKCFDLQHRKQQLACDACTDYRLPSTVMMKPPDYIRWLQYSPCYELTCKAMKTCWPLVNTFQ